MNFHLKKESSESVKFRGLYKGDEVENPSHVGGKTRKCYQITSKTYANITICFSNQLISLKWCSYFVWGYFLMIPKAN